MEEEERLLDEQNDQREWGDEDAIESDWISKEDRDDWKNDPDYTRMKEQLKLIEDPEDVLKEKKKME